MSQLALAESNLLVLPDRASWLAARREGVGGSDAAAIMGASRWKSPYALWAEKTGLVDLSSEETELTRWGHLMEEPIAREYERLTGRTVQALGSYTIRRHSRLPFMICTHDYIVERADGKDGPGPLSIKTAAAWKRDEWEDAEDGSRPEAPLEYEIQLQHEIACADMTWGSFAVLFWGKPLLWFDVDRNDRFIATLERECTSFWRRVETGDAPEVDGSKTATAALKAMYPESKPGAVVELSEESLGWDMELAEIKQQQKVLKERRDLLENRLKDELKDAEVGILPGGSQWTYKTQPRAGYTVEPTTCRVLLRRKDGKRK